LPAARATTAEWQQSNLDVWVYHNFSNGGSRPTGATFFNATVNESTQQFDPQTADEPARLGTSLVAFNTASNITPGLAPHRYHVTSVTMKAMIFYDSDPPNLEYHDQPISHTQILNEVAGGGITTKRPMELYGAGLRGGYSGYELSGAVPGPPLVDEISDPYPAGGYIAYPIVGSPTNPGQYVDVMNSVTGGYSASEPTHATAPFTPSPWAIGTTIDLAENNTIQDLATFTFNVDLNAPGVKSYVQESLSDGGLAFFLSSLHSTVEFGAGGGYPRWVLKESANFPYFFPVSRLPKLTIDYEIAPPLAGDYNDDGTVDTADYVLWRNGGPLANQVDDPSIVNQQDYLAWRARVGNSSLGTGSGLDLNQPLPEPTGLILALTGLLYLDTVRLGRIRL
jgi:hypothetical protein